MADAGTPLPFSARVPALLGLTASIHLAGLYFSTSYLTMPIVQNLHSSVSTPVFNQLYHRGILPTVSLAVFSGVNYLVAAYASDSKDGSRSRLYYALAAVATLVSLPWTLLVMMPTIKQLLAISTDDRAREKVGEEGTKALLKRWTSMNMMRCRFAFLGGIVGLLTFAGII